MIMGPIGDTEALLGQQFSGGILKVTLMTATTPDQVPGVPFPPRIGGSFKGIGINSTASLLTVSPFP